tara:strand:- start:609 stop:1775 length:1167 start_codon:yes stop_codon:yes gene_type:complete
MNSRFLYELIYLSIIWFLSIFAIGVDLKVFGLESQKLILIVCMLQIVLSLSYQKLVLKLNVNIIFSYILIGAFFCLCTLRVSGTISTKPYLTDWDIQNFNGLIFIFLIYFSLNTIKDEVVYYFYYNTLPYIVIISIILILYSNLDVFSAIQQSAGKLTTEMRLGSSREVNNINYWSMSIGILPAILLYFSKRNMVVYIAISLLMISLLSTFSRSGMLVALLAILIPQLKSLRLSYCFFTFLLLYIIVFMTQQYFPESIIYQRFHSIFTGGDASALGRFSVYENIYNNYESYLLGYGADFQKVLSHPTESFNVSSFIVLGGGAVFFIPFFLAINYFESSKNEMAKKLSHIPFLIFLIWFLDDPFFSGALAVSFASYQRFISLNNPKQVP